MDKNKKRILITVAVAAIAGILLSVVLGGMINGEWPWARKVLDWVYNGLLPTQTMEAEEEIADPTNDTALTTEETQESTTTELSGETETSTEGTTDSTEGTTEGGNDTTEPSLGVTVEDPNETQNTKPTNPKDKTIIDFGDLIKHSGE